MKIYFYTKNDIPSQQAWTSLVGVCKEAGIVRSSLARGKRVFIREDEVVRIHELQIIKTKRNENKKKSFSSQG